MGNDNDGFSVGLHAAEHVKKPGDLLRRQHRGRLVQDQDVRSAVQHLDNLHSLLLRDRHIINLFGRINVEAIALSNPGDLAADFLQIVALLLLHAQDHIFRRGEQIHQLEMLVNHADAVVKSILRGADHHLLTVDQDMALIREIDAGDHIHQRCLAASVFTKDGQDFPLINIKVHMIVREHGSKALGNPPHLKSKLFFHR